VQQQQQQQQQHQQVPCCATKRDGAVRVGPLRTARRRRSIQYKCNINLQSTSLKQS
jgi:hypothetical protein